jgi:hypothetical protein
MEIWLGLCESSQSTWHPKTHITNRRVCLEQDSVWIGKQDGWKRRFGLLGLLKLKELSLKYRLDLVQISGFL